MRLTIYTETRAERVPTGALVDGGDQGVILVDEKRERAEGSSVVVSLLGQRVGSGAARRVHLRYRPYDQVRILPDADEAAAAWTQVLAAVATGAKHWKEEHDDGSEVQEAAPWDTHRSLGAAIVEVAGTRFFVRPEPEAEDPGRRLPEASEPDDGPTADA
jgi:hypothetical protein